MPLTTNHVNNSTEILFNQLKTLLQNNKFNCTTMCFDDTQNNVNKILNKHPDAKYSYQIQKKTMIMCFIIFLNPIHS